MQISPSQSSGEDVPTHWIFFIHDKEEGGRPSYFFKCGLALVTIDASCARDYFTRDDWACELLDTDRVDADLLAKALPFAGHTITSDLQD
jgi:hypothetical protein